MNVILKGKTKEIVESMVKEGYANTQSEAVRLAIINFGTQRMVGREEVVLVNKGIAAEMEEINSGKVKVYTSEQVKKKLGL